MAKKSGMDAIIEFVGRIALEDCYENPGEFPQEGESGHARCLSCEARHVLKAIRTDACKTCKLPPNDGLDENGNCAECSARGAN